MDNTEQARSHLQQLAGALEDYGLAAAVDGEGEEPCLTAAGGGPPRFTERIYCRPGGEGGGWQFLWSWGQPVGPVSDIEVVAGRIATVLRPVGGAG